MVVENENLTLVEAYLDGQLSDKDRVFVENRVREDQRFAQDFGFYLQAKQVAKQTARETKRAEWEQLRQRTKKGKVFAFRPAISAAAACVVLAFSWTLFFQQPALDNLAVGYINENLSVLSVNMDATKDSLELGATLYNQKKYAAAVRVFEAVRFKKAQEESQAMTYAGLAYLQLKQYDKAFQTFQRLATNKEILNNKGKFYQALTLMRRNASGDKQQVIKLLDEVVKQNLGGKKEAIEWLKKLR